MVLAEKLKGLRSYHKLTQQKMADLIGVSRSAYSNIENGYTEATTLFVRCVSLLFHVDEAWLVDDSNDDGNMIQESTLVEYKIENKNKSKLDISFSRLKNSEPERLNLALQVLEVILDADLNN
ncbi:MAG: helix-turn-helix transcriptional regulator [Lachnospiraceae bacterium]|nr:helix-turn-helix transcriptional regulator [Lachnospiraceae bacterium]